MRSSLAHPLLALTAGTSAIPWWTLLVIGVLGVTVGAGVGYAVAGRHARQCFSLDGSVATTPSPPTQADPALQQLIESVIDARDLVEPSTVLARRLGAALSRAGVSEFAPLGQPYDPERHYAVGTEPAPDPTSADVVAEVQRVGYERARDVIRAAEVVVFRLEPVR